MLAHALPIAFLVPDFRDASKSSSLCSQPSERKENMRYLRSFIRDEQGQDMVEYALLAAFISIVAIATLRLIGPLVNTIYGNIRAALA
jgi:Flp pilus assembly pilin Flp